MEQPRSTESGSTRSRGATGRTPLGRTRRLLRCLVVVLLAALASSLVLPAAEAAPTAPTAKAAARHGKPGAPILNDLMGGADSLAIYYDPPVSNGGHKIRYYQATVNGGKTWKRIGHEYDADGYLTGYRNHLKVGKHYKVAVRAVNSHGHGKKSRVEKIIAMNAPSKPRKVRATVDGTSITVTWKAPKTDGGSPITDYVVLTNTDGHDFGCAQPTPASARSCTVTGLIPGASYYIQIWASNFVPQADDADPLIVGTGEGDEANPFYVVVP